MSESIIPIETSGREILKDKVLKTSIFALPAVFSIIPAFIFFLLSLFYSGSASWAVTLFFLSIASLIVGFFVGLGASAGVAFYRSRWLANLRERVSANGIDAEDVRWFRSSLKSEEKRALRQIEAKNPVYADAYRETLASRLTASKIIKSTNKELMLARRRKNKLVHLKSEKSEEYQNEIDQDIEVLTGIKEDATEMNVQAQSRLQMIEAAFLRGGSLTEKELTLQKLNHRAKQLPIALEAAKLEDDIHRELVRELNREFSEEDDKIPE